MHISNITVENSEFHTRKGIELIESTDINLKNITIDIKEKQPVVHIDNSAGLSFSNITFKNEEQPYLFDIKGATTKDITISGAGAAQQNSRLSFGKGAAANIIR